MTIRHVLKKWSPPRSPHVSTDANEPTHDLTRSAVRHKDVAGSSDRSISIEIFLEVVAHCYEDARAPRISPSGNQV